MKYILYGATKRTVSIILPYLEALDIKKNVLYLSDSNEKTWGTEINGWKVYSKDKIRENPEAVIIILAHRIDEIIDSMRENGVYNKVITYPWFCFSYVDMNMNSETLQLNRAYIESVENELYAIYNTKDFYTKNILDEIIRERKNAEITLLDHPERVAPFPSVHDCFYDLELIPEGDLTFLDAGAYTGDSIEQVYCAFGDRLKKIYAFEPAKDNLEELERRVQGMGIEGFVCAFPFGISDRDGQCFLSEADDGTDYRLLEEGKNYVEIRRIDSLNLDVIGNALLKMDIEGSELAALQGAKEFIIKNKPYMAICLYHKMRDIYEIPAYIKSICPDYTFFIRAGGHLECYAIPRKL